MRARVSGATQKLWLLVTSYLFYAAWDPVFVAGVAPPCALLARDALGNLR